MSNNPTDKPGVGECMDCGFEAADWICHWCGGYVCSECVEVYSDGSALCWNCANERYYYEKRIFEKRRKRRWWRRGSDEG